MEQKEEEDLWSSQVPLTNAQFRQLTETPLQKRKASLGKYYAGKRKESAKKPKAEPEIKNEESKEDEDLDDIIAELKAAEAVHDASLDRPFYRDRAKERREGTNADSTSQKLSLFTDSEGLTVDTKDMSVEQTKFLGGDLEHTHLVRGLDYALLNKERARIKMEASETEKKKKEEHQKQQQCKKRASFASPMGRAVFTALFRAGKRQTHTKFHPSRTAFLFNLENDKALGYRPTVLQRPKSEYDRQTEFVMANVDVNVVQTISTIISYIQPSSTTGSLQKKEQKKEKQKLLESILGPLQGEQRKQAPVFPSVSKSTMSEAKPPAAEDDIFADAGIDYKCTVSRKKKKKTETSAKPTFSARKAEEIEQNTVEDDLEEDDRDMLKVDRKTERSIDPMAPPDHYAECYPSFHQSYSAAVVDSDEEDLSHMDAKGKTASRSRYSFETDEQWSKYKQNMEKLPKAAFQYGVKMTDGRKSQSKLVDKHRKEQKLDSQLNKIEKIFRDQGHDHKGAFHSDKKKETSQETPSQPSLPTPKNRKRIRLTDS